MKTIKGDWNKKTDEVFSSQHDEFVFINSNGSRWVGQEPGDIAELIDTLENHPLDVARFGDAFIQHNPCRGIAIGGGKYVDGPQIFEVDTVHFWGNFVGLSHVFSIYTNSPSVINSLECAIRANLEKQQVTA